jgi:hypothetical protein
MEAILFLCLLLGAGVAGVLALRFVLALLKAKPSTKRPAGYVGSKSMTYKDR